MYNMNKFYEFISAFQKSIRWCDVNDSRYFARELMDMGLPGGVFNRLLKIAAEDVGLADPSLLMYERGLYDVFERLVKEYEIKKREAAEYPELCEVIDRAVTAAALSYKSRLLPMLSFATLFDIYRYESFGKGVSEYLKRFLEAVGNQDEKAALYYAYIIGVFLNRETRILAKIQNQSWRRNTELVQKWLAEYRRGKELLALAGSVVLLCRDLPYLHGEYKSQMSQYVGSTIKKAKIPDRAYDMHTRAGKKMGRGFRHFFKEGASLRKERFPNDWEDAGRNAYYSADRQGLGKAAEIIKAIKKRV